MVFEGQIKEMEHVLGSRVRVKCKRSGNIVTGELQFVGFNDRFPSWGLVCTINRTPAIHIDSVSDIEVLEHMQ